MLADVLSQAKILIVDDESANVRLLQLILERDGYTNVSSTTDSRKALTMFEEEQPDLVLLDLNMPHVTGYEVLASLRSSLSPETFLPIIILTADVTPQAKRRALTSGATDFLCKPFDYLEIAQRIKNVLHTRCLHLAMQNQSRQAERSGQERIAELEQSLADLRRAQDHDIQQERARAFGKMAAGIAHDFNNILSLILGYGGMLLNEPALSEAEGRAVQYVQNIINASEDGVEMVKRIAQFQRSVSEPGARQSVRLADLISQAIEWTRPRWKEEALAQGINISVETDFACDSEVSGDPSELREVLINSIFNAVDAMPEGGNLTFRTRADGDSVLLEIEDSGIGMTEETQQRCQESFFTTKGERGTGLGLAMISGIVQRHGGRLQIESRRGVGTKLQIHLPNEQRTEATTLTAPAPLPAVAPLRVLVVDDQPLLGEILTEYLQHDGHEAETASSGDEALRKFSESHFDLVITDQAMPGMSGPQLASAVRQVRKETMVILLTGFAESGVGVSENPEIDAVVGKPVASATLRAAIAHTLATRKSRQPQTTHLPSAGFLRTRPEGALTLSAIKDHFTGLSQSASLLLKGSS